MGTAGSIGGKKTILVVEDAEAIRKLVCAMLAHDGYRCLEASDGSEALSLVEQSTEIHLVLTDVVMPYMGGPELARRLADIRPDVRIIFMSGYSEDPLVHVVEKHSATFLAKPFTAAALSEKVRRALADPWKGVPDKPA